MLTAIVFILILGSAVFVHELAHYLNARSIGVPVRAFSIGMGPVLAKVQWQGTEWRLSLLPIGGYVLIDGTVPEEGEDGELRYPDHGLASKRLPGKLWVLVGGILANYAFGVVLLTAAIQLNPVIQEAVLGIPVRESGAEIVGVAPESAAARLGLQEGDVIASINGVADPERDAVIAQIQNSESLELVLARDGEQVEVSTAWPPPEATDAPVLGVSLAPLEIERPPVLATAGSSAWFAVRVFPDMVVGFVRGFASVLTGQQSEEVAGPVGMATMVGQAASVGLAPVLLLAAIINFSLAVFNLLPIPGLDGGRMLLYGIAAIRGRPFKPAHEATIHFIGYAALFTLIILITVNELGGLLGG